APRGAQQGHVTPGAGPGSPATAEVGVLPDLPGADRVARDAGMRLPEAALGAVAPGEGLGQPCDSSPAGAERAVAARSVRDHRQQGDAVRRGGYYQPVVARQPVAPPAALDRAPVEHLAQRAHAENHL